MESGRESDYKKAKCNPAKVAEDIRTGRYFVTTMEGAIV